MEALILFSALIIGYLLLRSRGGEGLDIKFELAPASSSKGKTNRLIVATVLVMWLAALIIVFAMRQRSERMNVVLVVVGSALVLCISFLFQKTTLTLINYTRDPWRLRRRSSLDLEAVCMTRGMGECPCRIRVRVAGCRMGLGLLRSVLPNRNI